MTRQREGGGMGLVARFAVSMGVALAVVGGVVGLVLWREARSAIERADVSALDSAAILGADAPEWRPRGATMLRAGRVERIPIEVLGPDGWQEARLFQTRPSGAGELVAPYRVFAHERDVGVSDAFGRLLAALVIGLVITAVVLVAVLASRATSPLRELVLQVRQIALGDLRYRSRVRAGGEVGVLARALDKMAMELAEAEQTRLELSLRQRELTVATEVREALIPLATPMVEGYDPGGLHLPSQQLGGGFHEWIERPDGTIGLLACDVSGNGLPAALVGASARAYLRSRLIADDDVREAFVRVNRELAREVRRGMFTTALFALLDPRTHQVVVACAGHRIPLLHWVDAAQKLRLVHPEGVALGLDKGPVFERTLTTTSFVLEPGDRIVLAGSGPIELENADGEELGEKRFFQAVGRAARADTPRFIKALRAELEAHQGGTQLSADVSLVTVRREA